MINWIRPLDTATIKMLQKFSKKINLNCLILIKYGKKKIPNPNSKIGIWNLKIIKS
jgi:hypothetical protein